jgi:hypothetical protein
LCSFVTPPPTWNSHHFIASVNLAIRANIGENIEQLALSEFGTYLMDNAVALASWSSIRDADVTESMNIVNVDVAQLDLHNHLPWGRLGDGAGHQFQSAQRILAVESILHNPNIGHRSNRCRTKQGNMRSTGGARIEDVRIGGVRIWELIRGM